MAVLFSLLLSLTLTCQMPLQYGCSPMFPTCFAFIFQPQKNDPVTRLPCSGSGSGSGSQQDYAESKALGEQAIRTACNEAEDFLTVAVAPHQVYGPRAEAVSL